MRCWWRRRPDHDVQTRPAQRGLRRPHAAATARGGHERIRTRAASPSPLQMMRVDVVKFNKRHGICKVDAKAYVGEDLVCQGELTLVMLK